MQRREPDPLSPQTEKVLSFRAAMWWLNYVFPWHVAAFLAVNAATTAINVVTGSPWWGLWVLLFTGALLGVHYLVYKAFAVDDRWVETRVQELNLKSYDRSHIEDLKVRHTGEAAAEGEGSTGPTR